MKITPQQRQNAADRDPPLAPQRKRFVNRLIAAIIVLSLAATLTKNEIWPFSPYLMYSDRMRAGATPHYRLYGESETSGEEFCLVNERRLAPMKLHSLSNCFQRLIEKRRDKELRIGVEDCLRRYEDLRSRGAHDGPPLRGLRLYRVMIASIDPVGAELPEPARELVLEVRKEAVP